MLIQGKREEPLMAMPEARGQSGPAAAAAVYKHAPVALSCIYAYISICLLWEAAAIHDAWAMFYI
jgi:hypothetical protein